MFDSLTFPQLIGLVFSAVSTYGVAVLHAYVTATRGEKKATRIQKSVASIVELASGAIAFAEDLDVTEKLKLSQGEKKGAAKLKEATLWMQKELNRQGVTMEAGEVEAWVRAQFQQQVGDGRTTSVLEKHVVDAVDQVLRLQQGGQLRPPAGADPLTHWAMLAGDYLLVQAAKEQATVSREDAETWVRSELLQRQLDDAPPPPVSKPTGDELRELAGDAIEFVQRLKAAGPLSLRASGDDQDAEATLLSSWLITEAAKRRLDVSTSDLARTLVSVLNS